MKDTLYIIGNGFDIHHKLNTSYADFREFFAKKNPQLWKPLSDIYGDAISNDMWWTDFESMLSKVDYARLLNTTNGETFGPNKVKNLLSGQLPPLFGYWLKELDYKEVEPDVDLNIADSYFFTFNYTLLLENVYGVKDEDVWHIHNSIRTPDEIVVGHDSDFGVMYKSFCDNRNNNPDKKLKTDIVSKIIQEVANNAKNTKSRIRQNSEKFVKYSEIKHFIAMGFSFNDIDMPYIEKIINVNRNLAETDWTVYYHSEGEDENIKGKLACIGIAQEQIRTQYW